MIVRTMLPRPLSEDLISLNPGVDRRALVFDILLDQQGKTIQTAIYRARIRSQAKLSYDGVQSLLDRVERSGKASQNLPYLESLLNLKRVGELRIARSHQRNVIEFNRREPRVLIDPDRPERFDIQVRTRNDVERYNEKISLLCNIQGAKMLLQHARLTPELQSVFRIHSPPLAQRLKQLQLQLDEIADLHRLGSNWRWSGKTELADYLAALPQQQTSKSIRQAIERQIMLSNNASHFSAEPGPHHALGVDAYARFSAPMREVAGIFTHKELLEALGLEQPHQLDEDLELQARVIEVSNFARQQQRRLDKQFQLLAIEQFLHADLARPLASRPRHSGALVGMDERRLFIAVDGFALDLKVYLQDLALTRGCGYQVEKSAAFPDRQDRPVFRTGDDVHLRVLEWNAEGQRFIMEINPAETT